MVTPTLFGDFGPAANTLINKISDAVGGYFKPYQLKRVAAAEAEAAIIRAQGDIDVTELQRRAVARFVGEEAKRQQNMEQIIAEAIPLLEEGTRSQEIEDDWVANFFDKCRIVSDHQMQALWARILAGEANSPGSYSKRTVNLLGSLDTTDATLFTSLCRFAWFSGWAHDPARTRPPRPHLCFRRRHVRFAGHTLRRSDY